MKISFIFAWYDLWIGAFWDKKKRWLYLFLIPCFGIIIKLKEKDELSAYRKLYDDWLSAKDRYSRLSFAERYMNYGTDILKEIQLLDLKLKELERSIGHTGKTHY